MGFWKSLKNMVSGNSETTSVTNQYKGESFDFTDWANKQFYGDFNSTVRQNPEVYSIITRLSSLLASLPIHQYKKGEESDGDLADLLRVEPNPNMSGFKLIRKVETDRNVTGNGFIFIERDELNTPVRLWPIDSGFVMIRRNTDDNSIWYQVDTENFHVLLSDTDMIHVSTLEVGDVDWGISPIDVLYGSLAFQKAVQDFSMSEMKKKNAYLVKYDRSVSPEKRQAILNDIANMEKANGGAVLQEAGFDIQRYESKFQPADLQTSEAISRTRIANAFNVPLSFLNDGQAKATVNVEHVMTQFVEMTLTPIVKQYEGEFNRKLLSRNMRSNGSYFKFNVNGLMRGDTAARTQFYQMGVRNGIFTINEMRKLEDLPPVKEKNADTVWFSGDLYPLNQAVQRTPNAGNMNNPPKGGENDEQSNEDSNGKDAKVSNGESKSKSAGSRHVY